MKFGHQTVRIAASYVGMNDNGNVWVNHKMETSSGETVYSKVYITAKSAGIARARLKKCGFDVDTQELRDIEDNPHLLAGNVVEVDIYEDDYNGKTFTRVEILTDRPKANPQVLSTATKALRAAKKENAENAGPDVQNVPVRDRQRLNAEAAQEDIPF